MAKQKLQPHIGGSFAPPLSDAKLDTYQSLINSLTASPIKSALTTLLACCRQWWDLPDSAGTEVRNHPSGVGVIVPIESSIMAALDDGIPWDYELDSMQKLFDEIPTSNRDLRNAAFHLLWHVKELNSNREPLTNDKL